MIRNKIKVNYPIEVPDTLYCWGGKDNLICQFFDNEGGHATCDLNFFFLKRTPEGWVLKPTMCKNLEEVI